MQWLQALDELKLPPLIKGNHPDGPEHGMCAMEMISYMERQPFSDNPEGVCDILRGFTVAINDLLPHDERQKLKPVLPMLVDTKVEPQKMEQRKRFLEETTLRNFDYHFGYRERGYDFERDCHRYGYRPDPRHRDRAYQYMREGPVGWVKLALDCLPPWHAADILISMLRDAVKVVAEKPRREFHDQKQVKELAKVIYLPEEKRKKNEMQPIKVPYNMPLLKNQKLLADFVA
jgi:hypothetical protein